MTMSLRPFRGTADGNRIHVPFPDNRYDVDQRPVVTDGLGFSQDDDMASVTR